MVGKTYGSLVVIKRDAETGTVTVRCECGAIETRKPRALMQGQVRRCQKCKERERYLESIKIDMSRLATLDPAIAVQVLKAYTRHLAACRKQQVRGTSFATFVTEALADPDLMNEAENEMDQSFEARYLRSNPQSYRQYHRPAVVEMI